MAKSKTDAIAVIQRRHPDLTKKQVTEVIDSLLQFIAQAMAAGEEVSLPGFGKFTTSKRAARTGRNPLTGATLQISESVVPKFMPGKALKDVVSNQ